uniref:Prohibitin n=1 Tax=Arcella intermedia TaxID=1963864 RepID=A0A6B2LC36_9EUKA
MGTLTVAALWKAIFNVEGGQRGIIFNKITGTRPVVFDEGTHLKIPFIEEEIIYDIRLKPTNIRSPTGSKDLQMMDIALRVLSKPDPNKIPTIHKTLGIDYNDRVLPSIVNEVTKAVVAQFTAAELMVKREQVSQQIKQLLSKRAAEFHITLDDVSITHCMAFGKEFRAAVESKQVAQQEAERARFLVEKAKQDKRSAILRAMGEAESARLIGQAVAQNPNFLKLRRLEASREIAEILAGSQNRVLLNADNLLMNTISKEEAVDLELSPDAGANFDLLMQRAKKMTDELAKDD